MITILGPTATGKTKLAARLAYCLNGEIISADSRQVYRGMDLGTGKDLKEYELNGTHIPFHLIDIHAPGYEYNVYEFQQDFLHVYQQIIKDGKTPILAGGTGLYIEAVLKGYPLLPVPENKILRATLSTYTHEQLIALLQTYKMLHNVSDTSGRERTIRAIEIAQHQLSTENKQTFPEITHHVFGIYLDRALICENIHKRLHERLASGMVEEVEHLLASGIQPEQLLFYGLEYKYITLYLTGKMTYEEMASQLNIAIRQFAKRQMTWFRRMEKNGIAIHWIDGLLPLEDKIQLIMEDLTSASKPY